MWRVLIDGLGHKFVIEKTAWSLSSYKRVKGKGEEMNIHSSEIFIRN